MSDEPITECPRCGLQFTGPSAANFCASHLEHDHTDSGQSMSPAGLGGIGESEASRPEFSKGEGPGGASHTSYQAGVEALAAKFSATPAGVQAALDALLDIAEVLQGIGKHADHRQLQLGACVHCSCGVRYQGELANRS